MAASADHHGATLRLFQFGLEPIYERIRPRRNHVIFHASGDDDAICSRAEGNQPCRVLLRLHEIQRRIVQYAPEETSNDSAAHLHRAREPAKGSVRQAPIHKYYRNARSSRPAQQIRPNFCFQNHDHARPHGPKRAPYWSVPIEWKVENGVREIHALMGQRLSCGSRRRDHQPPTRKALFQTARKRNRGQNFAHRDGMKPNRARSAAMGGELRREL